MSYDAPGFTSFIKNQSQIFLPGGFGTSLQLEGYKLRPESWSGEANLSRPDLLATVHDGFHQAGADIHTTNTFRTHGYFLARVATQFGDYARHLLTTSRGETLAGPEFSSIGEELAYHATRRAVDAALKVQRQSNRTVYVAGSYGPIGDTHSYDPHSSLTSAQLEDEHTRHAALLKSFGVQALFPETIPSLREAVAMTAAAEKTGLPYVTSFVLNPETGKLFDGTTIPEAVRATESSSRVAVLFNCTPAHVIGAALDQLLECYAGVAGAYPNGGVNRPLIMSAGIMMKRQESSAILCLLWMNGAENLQGLKYLGAAVVRQRRLSPKPVLN